MACLLVSLEQQYQNISSFVLNDAKHFLPATEIQIFVIKIDIDIFKLKRKICYHWNQYIINKVQILSSILYMII